MYTGNIAYEKGYLEEEAKTELFINGEKAGEVEIRKFIYTVRMTMSLKTNKYTSVNDVDYAAPFEYNGVIKEIKVLIRAYDTSYYKQAVEELGK